MNRLKDILTLLGICFIIIEFLCRNGVGAMLTVICFGIWIIVDSIKELNRHGAL